MLLRVANICAGLRYDGIIEFGGIWKKRGRGSGPLVLGISNVSNTDAGRQVERERGGRYSVEQARSGCLHSRCPYLDGVAG